MKITEDNWEVLKNAEDITGVDSGIVWTNAEYIEGFIETNDLLDIIKDLITEYHRKEEELQDKIDYCNEYHIERHINPYEEYGVSERDFY